MAFRLAVADGLGWNGLLNASQYTLVKMNGRPVGVESKIKTRGRRKEGRGGPFSYSIVNKEWSGRSVICLR